MGCGDGTLLIHLYNLIKTKTLRGKYLDSYPLHIIGADFNDEALEVTGKNLKLFTKQNIFSIKKKYWKSMVFNNELEKNYNIQLNDLLM